MTRLDPASAQPAAPRPAVQPRTEQPRAEQPPARILDLRVASRAATVAAIAWLTEPIAFAAMLFNPANMDPEQTLADFHAGGLPFAYLVAVGLIVCGAALAVLTIAIDRQYRARGDYGIGVAFAKWAGLTAATALLIAGAIDLTGNGLGGIALTIIPDASEGARWLARQTFMISHEALRLTACLAFAAWLVLLARRGRKLGLIGRGVAVTVVIAGILIALPGAATGLLTGMNFVLLALIPLAVAFARRSRPSSEV
ncbi:hypothetical protein [Agromyces seonyuensis]|uniref:DUF4386 family protein n=1 Tax=Agromyces seonyuensis TaxID=2662446 RepID=A0A6I4NW68_9MICO|nr:hypothetical protein [Agromyces seonyuensis]MWB98686.1 hypothetical protein [Agromyces seonyuensis]